MPVLRRIGKPLPTLGGHLARPTKPEPHTPGDLRYSARRSLDYARIKREVYAAIEKLPREKQALIPAAGTLPEVMTCLALVWLHYTFQVQINEDGGRIRLGGAVVDVKLWLGAHVVILRVQGSYFHSLPDRRVKDAVQLARLRAQGYRVVDLWENALYQAWVDGRLAQFVESEIKKAI